MEPQFKANNPSKVCTLQSSTARAPQSHESSQSSSSMFSSKQLPTLIKTELSVAPNNVPPKECFNPCPHASLRASHALRAYGAGIEPRSSSVPCCEHARPKAKAPASSNRTKANIEIIIMQARGAKEVAIPPLRLSLASQTRAPSLGSPVFSRRPGRP